MTNSESLPNPTPQLTPIGPHVNTWIRRILPEPRRSPPAVRLRRRREHARLTQAALAAVSGLAQSSVSRFESGQLKMTPTTRERVARALHCDPVELAP